MVGVELFHQPSVGGLDVLDRGVVVEFQDIERLATGHGAAAACRAGSLFFRVGLVAVVGAKILSEFTADKTFQNGDGLFITRRLLMKITEFRP